MGAQAQAAQTKVNIKKETVEDIVLRHSKRGMTILRKYMGDFYCKRAAEKILELPKGNIFLTTGFYVAGHAETDGPLGTMTLAKALRAVGYRPIIVTDKYCRGFFELENLDVEYAHICDGVEQYTEVLEDYDPVALISIERCGKNIKDDYANMRGVSIKKNTAKADILFDLAKKRGIPTFGVGDGGNEIGMGNLKEVIVDKLALVPCKVEVDNLIIATVSNWGAYALAAYIQKIEKIQVLPTYKEIKSYLQAIVDLGSIDGVTKEQVLSVDGFPLTVEKEILDELHRAVGTGIF